MPAEWTLGLLIFSACLLTGLALVSVSQKNNLPAAPFGIALFICAAWCLISIFEVYVNSLEGKLIFLQLRATIIPWLPLFMLEAIYRFVYGKRLMIGTMALAFSIVPIVNAALAWTCHWQGFWRHEFRLVPEDGYSIILFTNGPWLWLYMLWAYIISVSMIVLLCGSLPRISPWGRKATWAIIASMVIPSSMDLLYLFERSPVPGVNCTPLSFALSVPILAWILFKHRLGSLSPVVRSVLMEHLPDLIVIIDREKHLIDVNRAACKAFDINIKRDIGKPLSELFEGWPSLLRVLENEELTTKELELNIGKLDSIYEIKWIASPEHSNNPRAYIVTLRDISLHKKAEQMMQRAKENAESAATAKGQFLALMSHEIRTPLNGVIGFTELLSQTSLNKEQHEYVDLIQKSGESLLVIINDILDYSKIDAGFLEMHTEPFALRSLVDRVCRFLSPAAKNKGLSFDWAVDGDLPTMVEADDIRIGQILTNLISNAIKFTSAGVVNVQVRRAAQKQDSKDMIVLDFVVKDSGIGMSEEVVAQLFEPFTQADSSTARKFGGTGLGLTISLRLAELMGGTIHVTSAAEKGSEFTVSIPVKSITAPTAHSIAPASSVVISDSESLSILVVEDNAINRRVIQSLLKKLGHEVDLAEDGQQCLQMCNEKNYDLIFMDIEMPGIDGFEAARQLRAMPQNGDAAKPRIIALTAHAMPGYQHRCMESGMDGYLTKPIHLEELKKALRNEDSALT